MRLHVRRRLNYPAANRRSPLCRCAARCVCVCGNGKSTCASAVGCRLNQHSDGHAAVKSRFFALFPPSACTSTSNNTPRQCALINCVLLLPPICVRRLAHRTVCARFSVYTFCLHSICKQIAFLAAARRAIFASLKILYDKKAYFHAY